MKKVFFFLLFSILFVSSGFAQEYIFFYGNGCSHCLKVKEFFKENNIFQRFDIEEKEIYFNGNNRKEFLSYGQKLGINSENMGVPLLIVNTEMTCNHLVGGEGIIDYFKEKIQEEDKVELESCKADKPITGLIQMYDKYTIPKEETINPIVLEKKNINIEIVGSGGVEVIGVSDGEKSLKDRLAFFAIMLPAAISDSINPCEFAIIILLLGTILVKTKSRRKAIVTGLAFSLSIFISYFLLGLGLWKIFSTTTNTNLIKIIAGSLGIVVGLANLKDVFWYGKGFVMEVPFSRRNNLKSFVQKITSPIGAFFIGIIVSLFLLPCTSGPYITILSYLSSENIDKLWGLIYLFVYNLFFVLPMVIITILVTFGVSKTDKLNALKDKYNRLIHLIVGLLMLGLGLYVFISM